MTAKIHLSGRLGSDAEIQELSEQSVRVNFSVAEDRFDKEGKKTDWFNCAWYTKPGNGTLDLLKKGAFVVLHGDIITNKSQSTPPITYYNVVLYGASSINVVNTSGQREQRGRSGANGYAQPPQNAQPQEYQRTGSMQAGRSSGMTAPPPPDRYEAPPRGEFDRPPENSYREPTEGYQLPSEPDF